jgi:23S rRNA (cytosine1962-C5)-methyltransferase
MARPFPAVTVTRKAEKSLRAGHPWVFDTETDVPNGTPNGAICDIYSEKGSWLGAGLLSLHSKIRFRIISCNTNDRFDDSFWARRVKYAVDYRLNVMAGDLDCCRLIFGESDGIPGLVVDKFGEVLVVQSLSFGIDARKDVILSSLLSYLKDVGIRIDGIYERNDSQLRELEGLEQYKGWLERGFCPRGSETVVTAVENGIKYAVDIENGQKTGFFLDQKYNRRRVAELARGKRVLDCFTHTGSFALNAALGGAEHVTAVDVSETAVELAKYNAKLNGLDGKIDFICADVFDLLPRLCEERAYYNFTVLDPPAFTKSRRAVAGAERGYKEINFRAMKLLPRGGWLASCSCSHFMGRDRFESMLISAARDADVQLKLIESRGQSPDHPTLLGVPETDYLKFYLFQVI